MFGPITIPYGAKLLFNTVKLKPGVTYDDVEVALAAMCSNTRELGYDMLWQGAPEPAHAGAGGPRRGRVARVQSRGPRFRAPPLRRSLSARNGSFASGPNVAR